LILSDITATETHTIEWSSVKLLPAGRREMSTGKFMKMTLIAFKWMAHEYKRSYK
jgi:hypothetical protein